VVQTSPRVICKHPCLWAYVADDQRDKKSVVGLAYGLWDEGLADWDGGMSVGSSEARNGWTLRKPSALRYH